VNFYVGLHQPGDARHFPRACISINRLRTRKKPVECGDVLVDSGAFTELHQHGRYRHSVADYAADLRRLHDAGVVQISAAVAQDYMCEPFVLERTGLTVSDHQRLTIERYDALIQCDTAGIPIMPVVQGYEPSDYADHVRQYCDRLQPGMWVGVGSVCKRNRNPGSVVAVLDAIHAVRPDLRLHGFGVKITALRNQRVRELFHSADSMAWSFAARYEGRDGNDIGEAIRYAAKVDAQPVQHVLFAGAL
jgi:hypothetical protein